MKYVTAKPTHTHDTHNIALVNDGVNLSIFFFLSDLSDQTEFLFSDLEKHTQSLQ